LVSSHTDMTVISLMQGTSSLYLYVEKRSRQVCPQTWLSVPTTT